MHGWHFSKGQTRQTVRPHSLARPRQFGVAEQCVLCRLAGLDCSLQVGQPKKEKEKNKGQKKASARAKNIEAHEMDYLAAGFLEGVAE